MKSLIKVVLLFAVILTALWFARDISSDIPMEEYDIVSELFNQSAEDLDSLRIERLIIVDSTYCRYSLTDKDINIIEKYFEFKIPEEVIRNFQKNNKQKYKINRFYEFEVEYILISQNELDVIFDKGVGSGWSAFDSLYTNSTGRIYFSRLGFNYEKDEALLYYDIRSGGLSGAGFFIYLKKKNGKWKDLAWARMWIS